MSERDDAGCAVRSRAVRLQLLDGFRLEVDGEDVPVARSHQRLFALLGLHRALLRDQITGLLWSDMPERNAQASLRTLLWRVGKCYPELLRVSADRVSWTREVAVDVRVWSDAAQQMLTDPTQLSAPVAEPVTGELLPGWYEDWVLVERERLRQLHLHVLEARAERLLAARRHALALDVALLALGLDPLRESAHRLVIRVHLAEGNVVEARRQFALCRRILADEFGVPPSTDLEALTARASHMLIFEGECERLGRASS